MHLIRGLNHYADAGAGCVATIGNFDGLHLGHRAIIERLKSEAGHRKLPALVISFEPLPAEFFGRQHEHRRLMNFRDKVRSLDRLGVGRFLVLHFDAAFAAMTAHEFVQGVLRKRLGVRHLFVGDDFRFGANREGDFNLLREFAGPEFQVSATHTLLAEQERISSTRIRHCLSEGNLDKACQLLGRPYQISARVVVGDGIGRTLGFPTANLRVEAGDIPLRGVFSAHARVNQDDWKPAVVNLGTRPTLNGDAFRAEVHLLDFKENLYRQHLSVRFVDKLRDERRFESLDALKCQIQQDVTLARTQLQQTI